jgi:hypothetical protein
MNNRALLNTVGALVLVFSTASPIWSARITLRVDAGRPVHTMRGGLGASWHAMETPIRPVHTMRGGLGASWHAMETPIPDRKGGRRAVKTAVRWRRDLL